MEVEYVLRLDDLLAFNMYIQARRRGFRLGRWLLPLPFGLAAGLAWLTYRPGDSLVIHVILTGVFLGLSIVALRQRAMVMRQIRRQLQGEPRLLGWRRLAIGPEAVTFTSKFVTITARWPGVDPIAVTEDHAFLFTTKLTGIIVPVRAFPDDEAFRDFVKAARRYQRAADDGADEEPPPRRRSRDEDTRFTAEGPTGD
jgi:hypothetical protein